MTLELPHVKYKDSYVSYLRELRAEGRVSLPDVDRVEDIAADFENFVRTKRDHREARNLPENYVPYTELWMIEVNAITNANVNTNTRLNTDPSLAPQVVGRISIRHNLNEALKSFGGHIGYEVRPTATRRGYATEALALILEHAKGLGLHEVMVTCADDNVASIKVIESNGGELLDKLKSANRAVETRRYNIKFG